jgi:hypothetical protein
VHDVLAPALIMIGGVVSLHEQLGTAGTLAASVAPARSPCPIAL